MWTTHEYWRHGARQCRVIDQRGNRVRIVIDGLAGSVWVLRRLVHETHADAVLAYEARRSGVVA